MDETIKDDKNCWAKPGGGTLLALFVRFVTGRPGGKMLRWSPGGGEEECSKRSFIVLRMAIHT